MRNGITVICAGYNEEKRADKFFKSVAMFDEIIFINRGCTDKTCEIAKKYNAIVVDMPHEIPEREHIESKKIINKVYNMASNRWVINLTFADIVHPKLYEKLIKTINKKDFDYTVVDVPWVEYLFGEEDECIPRCHYSRPVLRRKDMIKDSVVTHHEMDVFKKKEYKMKKDKRVAVHHMTYFNLQYSFKEQNVRYAIKEVETYYKDLDNPKRAVIKQMMTEVKNDIEKIEGGKKQKKDKNIIKHARMICMYRSISYYMLIYLILWSKQKKVWTEKLFCDIYNCLDSQNNTKNQFTKIYFKILKDIPKNTGENIIALFFAITIVVIMKKMYVWDNSKPEPVEKKYEAMKDSILGDN